MPVPVRPPCVVTSQPEGVSVPGGQVRASTLRTSTWLPNRSAISASSSGRATAAELTPTLSAPAAEQPLHVAGRADAAAHGERDEDLLGGRADHVEGGVAPGGARAHVEEGDLVRALGVVAPGQLDRVAGVLQALEPDPLDHPPRVDVEAGDDTDGHAHAGILAGRPGPPGARTARAGREVHGMSDDPAPTPPGPAPPRRHGPGARAPRPGRRGRPPPARAAGAAASPGATAA